MTYMIAGSWQREMSMACRSDAPAMGCWRISILLTC